MAEYLLPGIGIINETETGEFLLPGLGIVNETEAAAVTSLVDSKLNDGILINGSIVK